MTASNDEAAEILSQPELERNGRRSGIGIDDDGSTLCRETLREQHRGRGAAGCAGRPPYRDESTLPHLTDSAGAQRFYIPDTGHSCSQVKVACKTREQRFSAESHVEHFAHAEIVECRPIAGVNRDTNDQ